MNPYKKKKITIHISPDLERLVWNIGKHHFFAQTTSEAIRQLLAYAVRQHEPVLPIEL